MACTLLYVCGCRSVVVYMIVDSCLCIRVVVNMLLYIGCRIDVVVVV